MSLFTAFLYAALTLFSPARAATTTDLQLGQGILDSCDCTPIVDAVKECQSFTLHSQIFGKDRGKTNLTEDPRAQDCICGIHNNWSSSIDSCVSCLSSAQRPYDAESRLNFYSLFINTIKGIHNECAADVPFRSRISVGTSSCHGKAGVYTELPDREDDAYWNCDDVCSWNVQDRAWSCVNFAESYVNSGEIKVFGEASRKELFISSWHGEPSDFEAPSNTTVALEAPSKNPKLQSGPLKECGCGGLVEQIAKCQVLPDVYAPEPDNTKVFDCFCEADPSEWEQCADCVAEYEPSTNETAFYSKFEAAARNAHYVCNNPSASRLDIKVDSWYKAVCAWAQENDRTGGWACAGFDVATNHGFARFDYGKYSFKEGNMGPAIVDFGSKVEVVFPETTKTSAAAVTRETAGEDDAPTSENIGSVLYVPHIGLYLAVSLFLGVY